MRTPAINHKNILLEDVDSSMISKIGYDENNKILKVVFKNGGVYIYTNVEPFHFKNMTTNVKSVGKYFNDNIKDYSEKYICFRAEDVAEDKEDEASVVSSEEINNMINNL